MTKDRRQKKRQGVSAGCSTCECSHAPMRPCSTIEGQAMIEFMVGLVAVLALFVGLLQIAVLTKVQTESMVEARREAGKRAIMGLDILSSPHSIRDWEEGSDSKRHTADDEYTPATSGEFNNTIVRKAAVDSEDWGLIDGVLANRVSRLRDSGASVFELGLVRGYHRETVELMSAVQSLLYRAESIDIESEVWMTQTGDIF